MIHPSYRRLDEPSKLGPFTIRQWIVLALITLGCWALNKYVHIHGQYIACLWMACCGTPVGFWIVSEGDRPSYTRAARALLRWALAPKHLSAGPPSHARPLTIRPDHNRGRRNARQPAALVEAEHSAVELTR